MKEIATAIDIAEFEAVQHCLAEGHSLAAGEDGLNVAYNGQTIGSIHIYPLSVNYLDLATNRRYFADINTDNDNSGTISPDLGININLLAEKLRNIEHRMDKYEQAFNPHPNLLEKFLPYLPTYQQREALKALSSITTMEGLFKLVFPGRNDLSLVDIGSGYGEFPLSLAVDKSKLGISEIKATDKFPELMNQNLEALTKAGVTVEKLDITGDVPKNSFDIVTCNAPYLFGKHAFADVGVPNMIRMIRKPGLLLLRLAEFGSDALAGREDLSLVGELGVRVKTLEGLPLSSFGRDSKGNSASVYVVMKGDLHC